MEIPTAVIHRLQSSLREATFAPAAKDAPAPPFPSLAEAVAAFDSSSPSVSAELRCVRCGAAGGLLRGAQSALCAYCGCPRRGEEAEGGGSGGIAFRDGPAYRWLLGSLGLDGSESVEFDTYSTASNKSKDAPPPNSGMIISDLLDLKITCLPENKETSASSITKEQSSSVDTLNLSAANIDSLFIERKEEMTSASLQQTHNGEQEKNSKSHESRLEVHAASKSLISSQGTDQTEATPAFASWDADFQSASSESAAKSSKQPDLFKSSSVAESFSFPASETAIKPVVGTENKTNTRSAILEHHSEDLASASSTLFGDDLCNQKVAQPIFESNRAPEFTESSLHVNFAKSDQLHGRDDNGVNDDDEAFDEWQEFTASGDQGSLSNAGEHTEEPLKRDSSENDVIDPWPVGSKESPNNVIEDSSNEWQAFASVSGQGRNLVTSEELSTSGHELNLVRPVEETLSSISHQHSSEINPVDLWPVGNVKAQNAAETVKETNDSFDDWQEFTTTSQVQDSSLNQTVDMEVPKASHKETDMDSWFIGNFREPANTGTMNENNILDDWQGFTGSDQAQQNSSSTGAEMISVQFEQHDGTVSVQSWANGRSNDGTKTSLTNIESDTFDVWQDFTKSDQLQENMSSLGREPRSESPELAKENDSLDLWITSNFKESKSSDIVGRTNASSDGWPDFASFDQDQSTKIPVEGRLVKDPSGAETLDLWASSHANERNLEQIGENSDLFDDWQDFQNSHPKQTTLQVSSDASLFDITSASRPDAFGGLEFGTVLQLASPASSKNLNDKKEASNEAKAIPSDGNLISTSVQQTDDADSLSSLLPTTKTEPANANVEQLLAQMHDLSFMLKDELSVADKSIDHSKS